ncbi:MAG: hypothetical protein ABR881_31605 [Candidatus Sulfotelmatobacter sp.]
MPVSVVEPNKHWGPCHKRVSAVVIECAEAVSRQRPSVHPEWQTVACERCEWRVHLEGPRRVVLITVRATTQRRYGCGQVNSEWSLL